MIYDAHTHPGEFPTEHLNQHVVSADLRDWEQLVLISRGGIPCSIGIHPWFAAEGRGELPRLESLLEKNPQLNIGEIGLDYCRAGIDRRDQCELFELQLELAVRLDRLVTVHSVKAWGDILKLIRKTGVPERGLIFHGFRGSAEIVRELLACNSFFSFGESQLLGCGKKQLTAIKSIPLDRLLLESDGMGDMTVAQNCLSEILHEEPDRIRETANSNFVRIFNKMK